METHTVVVAALIALLVLACAAASAGADDIVPNPSFERGAGAAPTGWTLEGGGAWATDVAHTGKRCIAVTGDGTTSSYWRTDLKLKANAPYVVSFWLRGDRSAPDGCAISGPDFANRDYGVPSEWTRRESVFVAPAGGDHYLRFGHWKVSGTVYFDDIAIHEVTPVHRRQGTLVLGAGERIGRGAYLASPISATAGGNYHRTLAAFSAAWNTNRWRMGDGAFVMYRHDIGDIVQRAAQVTVDLSYYQSGSCRVEASNDGGKFVPVGEIGEEGRSLPLPPELFPARAVWVRLSAQQAQGREGDSDPGSFQLTGYTYRAELATALPDMAGETSFLKIAKQSPDLSVTVDSLGSLRPAPRNEARIVLETQRPRQVKVRLAIGSARVEKNVALKPGRTPVKVAYSLTAAGESPLVLAVSEGARKVLYEARSSVTVPMLFAADYGALLSAAPLPLWWCGATYKVSTDRPLPQARGKVVRLAAARNEYESFQLILRPEHGLQDVTVQASPLVGPMGAEIAPPEIRLVGYVNVVHPTDQLGTPGLWPDPLLHYKGAFDVPAHQNQPIWLTAYVPPDAAPGTYRGTVTVSAGDDSVAVPVHLKVWNFTLPKESTISSGFGFSPGLVAQYDNISADALAQVVDQYYRAFQSHRISPYSPMRAPVVSFGRDWDGGEIVSGEAFDGQRCMHVVDSDENRAVDARTSRVISVDPLAQYRFTLAFRAAQPQQQVQATLGQFDADGQWLYGRNIDLVFDAAQDWRTAEVDLSGRITPDTRSVQIVLRPCLWTEDGRNTGEAWFDAVRLIAADSTDNLVPNGGFEDEQEIEVTFDWADFDRDAEYYLGELGFNSFNMRVAGLGGGTFHSAAAAEIAGTRAGTPEYDRVMAQYLGGIQQHLEQKGWLDKAYVYWFDEPSEEQYEYVRGGLETLRRFAPKLNRFLTEHPVEPLYGSVNTWCVPVGAYDPETCQERQRAGDEVWWYLCCGPHAPWVGLFIDHPAVDFRTWLWMSHKYGVTGILIWQTNYWTSSAAFPPPEMQNPYEDPMSYVSGYGTSPGTRLFWGNGDGRLWYPSNRHPGEDDSPYADGPVPSIRVELLREGIEDYEYFQILKKLADRPGAPAEAKALLEIPEDIIRDLTHYSFDPEPMMRHRAKVAAMIERLAD